MLASYFSILVFALIALLFALVPLGISLVFAPRKPSAAKQAVYECGVEPIGDAHKPMHIRFFVLAVLFLIFDVEVVFFFPWAVSLRHIGWYGFFAMLFFMLLIGIGFAYEWLAGALEWR
jgi:NADH-quinone oxidoreductase subunit A